VVAEITGNGKLQEEGKEQEEKSKQKPNELDTFPDLDQLTWRDRGQVPRTSCTRSIRLHCSQRYWMTSLPSSAGAIFSSLIVFLQAMQEISVRSGL
jgi:hypothetical protein